jgi:hypothetical protein
VTDQTAAPCNAAQLHRLGDLQTAHGPHEWIVQPGMDPVRCPGAGEQPAAPAVQAPATDRAALRDRIAAARDRLRGMALDLATGSGLVEPSAFDAALDDYRDAIAAVLPAPADRAAVLRKAADRLDAGMEQFFTEWPDEPRNSPYALGQKDAATELRRMADEAQPTEVLRPPATEWTFEACYDADNDKWHGIGGTYTDRDQARADFEHLKRTDTTDRLTHYSPRLKVRLVRATTTYVVEAERTPADAAQQDEARP